MKVENLGSKIKIEADYIEIATIVQVLDDWISKSDDQFVKDLAYQLKNAKVETGERH